MQLSSASGRTGVAIYDKPGAEGLPPVARSLAAAVIWRIDIPAISRFLFILRSKLKSKYLHCCCEPIDKDEGEWRHKRKSCASSGQEFRLSLRYFVGE